MYFKPFSQMTKGIKVHILSEKFPQVILTAEQIEVVMESILDKIIELRIKMLSLKSSRTLHLGKMLCPTLKSWWRIYQATKATPP